MPPNLGESPECSEHIPQNSKAYTTQHITTHMPYMPYKCAHQQASTHRRNPSNGTESDMEVSEVCRFFESPSPASPSLAFPPEVTFFHHRLRVHLAVQPQHCPTCAQRISKPPSWGIITTHFRKFQVGGIFQHQTAPPRTVALPGEWEETWQRPETSV